MLVVNGFFESGAFIPEKPLSNIKGRQKAVLYIADKEEKQDEEWGHLSYESLFSVAETAGIAGEWKEDIEYERKSAWASAAVKKEKHRQKNAKRYGVAGY